MHWMPLFGQCDLRALKLAGEAGDFHVRFYITQKNILRILKISAPAPAGVCMQPGEACGVLPALQLNPKHGWWRTRMEGVYRMNCGPGDRSRSYRAARQSLWFDVVSRACYSIVQDISGGWNCPGKLYQQNSSSG